MTIKCNKCDQEFEMVETNSTEQNTVFCPHCNNENKIQIINSQPISEKPQKKNKEISMGLKIYDYILAGISGLEFIWQLISKLSGNSAREWIWVILPLLLVFGLLRHQKTERVICSILLFGSILLPFILMGMISGY